MTNIMKKAETIRKSFDRVLRFSWRDYDGNGQSLGVEIEGDFVHVHDINYDMQWGRSTGFFGVYRLRGLLSKLRAMRVPRTREEKEFNNKTVSALSVPESVWNPYYDGHTYP